MSGERNMITSTLTPVLKIMKIKKLEGREKVNWLEIANKINLIIDALEDLQLQIQEVKGGN